MKSQLTVRTIAKQTEALQPESQHSDLNSMPRTKLPFYPGLEGLRGVSVAAVLVFHAWPWILPGGFLGVSTFFTLSGFLITGLLLGEWSRTGRISFGHFWKRRARRLFPAALIGLALIAVSTMILGDTTQRDRVTGDGMSALFYVSNWWLIGTGASYDRLLGSPSPLQHYWSLSIEEQYYLVYPLLTALTLSLAKGSRRVFAIVLSLAVVTSWAWMAALGAADVATARVYYGTDTRCGELLAGGLLAIIVGSRQTGLIHRAGLVQTVGLLGFGMALYAWTTAEVESIALYEWGLALYTLSSLALITAALQPRGPIPALLSIAPLRWLGRVSYGLYVYHWPVLLWLNTERTGLGTVAVGLLGIGLSLILSAASYRWIEMPIRSRQHLVGRNGWIAAPVAIAAVAIVLVGTAPESTRVLVQGLVKESDPASEPRTSKATLPLSPTSSDTAPARTRPLSILVAGDSVARDIGEGLAAWARLDGTVDVVNVAAKGCGIARGAWVKDERSRRVCDQWPDRFRNLFKRLDPDVIVVGNTSWDLKDRKISAWQSPRSIGDPDFDRWLIEEYRAALEVFFEAAETVVWLNSPCVHWPRAMAKEFRQRRQRMNRYILPQVQEKYGSGKMKIIDLSAAICPNDEFAASLHGIQRFRPDGRHFSDEGKIWIGNWLGPLLLER